MIYKKLKTIRGFTKSTDLVIRTKKLIKKSRETVPLNCFSIYEIPPTTQNSVVSADRWWGAKLQKNSAKSMRGPLFRGNKGRLCHLCAYIREWILYTSRQHVCVYWTVKISHLGGCSKSVREQKHSGIFYSKTNGSNPAVFALDCQRVFCKESYLWPRTAL